jgi:iron complex transport system substrate-binding protein
MRIVSLSPSVTETLVLLGLEDEIVGVTPWCLPYLKNPHNKVIAGTYTHIFIDRLKQVNPDIVFLQSRVHDGFLELVKKHGFKAYLIPLPTNVYAIISHIILDVGAMVGRYYESRDLAERFLQRVYRVFERSRNVKKRPRVYIEYLWPDKSFSTAGALTFIDDGIWIAGGVNIYRDIVWGFFTPRDEDTVQRDPEVVLVNLEPFMNISIEEYKKIRKSLENTKAFKEGRVYLVKESREVNLAHFGPSFANTIEWMSGILQNIA